MKFIPFVAIALIAGGAALLVYGQVTYTRDVDKAKLGPIELTVTEKETVNVPNWAGVGTIVAGTALLLYKR